MTDDLSDATDDRSEPNLRSAAGRKGGRLRVDAIHRALRDRICFFDAPPGTLLLESKLAELFGVSRTPIRQALQRLEVERLVDVRDGVGTIVTAIKFEDLREVYDLRMRITEMIGDFALKTIPPGTLAEIDRLLARTQQLRERSDVRLFWRAESDRHRLINGLIANDPLRELHDRLFTQTARVWYGIVETIWDEAIEALTDELVELRRAIVAGDIKAVGLVSRNYVSYSIARFVRYFATSSGGAERLVPTNFGSPSP